MTSSQLCKLVGKLETMLASKSNEMDILEDFVYEPNVLIEGMKKSEPEHLKKPHCWGAFVLVGYGQIPISGTVSSILETEVHSE
jgi:hypothetical protein